MARFSLPGILLTIGLFLLLSGFVLTKIDIPNPFTGNESSIFSVIIGWIVP